jgi:amino acid adenylation domain-containing protein
MGNGTLLGTIAKHLDHKNDQLAFCINQQSFSYAELATRVSGIMDLLKAKQIPAQTRIGLLATDQIETYASILALWYSRMVFVPISPANPPERNQSMREQAGITYLLSADSKEAQKSIDTEGIELLETQQLSSRSAIVPPPSGNNEDLLYILFTSGSTGQPKGVPISVGNLQAYVDAFFGIGYELDNRDRFLQIFDFTFDVSVQSYVLPLYLGASVYTVPQDGIRFLAALKILQQHQITFAKLVPSTLLFFKPYFRKIHLPALRYSLFSGEALPEAITREWSACVPNAIIENHYGPTEATIDCLSYRWNTAKECSYNGIVSIGSPFEGMEARIVKKNGQPASANEKGELWISGKQLTPGYWKNGQKNREAFVQEGGKRFYKTGDLVFQDDTGHFMFCGRIDNQVQIQGYRVELGEVEYQIKKWLPGHLVVDTYQDKGVLSLVLFVEGAAPSETTSVQQKLQASLPHYMIPSKVVYVEEIPRTVSGKTDRKALQKLL